MALAGLHLLVLWSFVAVQPLLDLLGDAPEFFVARQNTTGDILVLAFALTLVPPAVLTALEAVVGRFFPRVRHGLHLTLVGLLLAALALQLLGSPGVGATVTIALALAVGAMATVAYARTKLVPSMVTVLAPAPAVFLVVFLLISPVSELVVGGDEAAAADVTIAGDTPVVMLVFDELSGVALMGPDHRIDAGRLPNVGRLARDATWYRNATAAADFTDRAVPAILTGERPERDSVPTASDHPESLFTFLGRSYEFQVTEPITDICPRQLCPAEATDREPARERLNDLVSDLSVVSLHLLLPDDLGRDLPPVDRSFGGFGDADATDVADGGSGPGAQVDADAGFRALLGREQQVEAFIRAPQQPSRKPRLSFLHTSFPHNPYDHLPDGRRYAGALPGLDPEAGQPGGVWRKDPAFALDGRERYLLQVGYADRLLGRVIARLRQTGLYDRALIVVASDHGVSFDPGVATRAVNADNFAEVASVPLLIKVPGQRGGRIDDANVNNIDVLPTVASLLDSELPWRVDGVPAGSRSTSGRVEMQSRRDEGTESLPFAEFVRRRNAAVDRMSADFVLSRRVPVRRSVIDADLVGRQVSSIGLLASPQGRVELDRAAALRTVDPRGETVPFVIAGRLTGDGQPGERMAIAVNGRVATVVRPFREGDARRFSALVPPDLFVRGNNRVDVVRVTGTGSARRLRLVKGADLDPRLVRDEAGREMIVQPDGRRVPVGPGVEGSVDTVGGDVGLIELKGWAGDTQRPRAAERVIAFSGSRLLGSTRPDADRPDLAKRFGRGLARAGFRIGGSTPVGPNDPRLRVFAVLDGRASVIPRAKRP